MNRIYEAEMIAGMDIANHVFTGKSSLIHREALAHLCDMATSAPPGLCVELGVYRGSSLAALGIAREGMGGLVGIDDWSYGNAPELYGKTNDVPDLYDKTVGTLKYFEIEAMLLTMTTDAAVDLVTEPIAFLHIDANHNYDFVKRYIENWTPKVMPGGIVAFHDYGRHRADIQVKQAVDEWQAREPWFCLGEVLTTIGYRKP